MVVRDPDLGPWSPAQRPTTTQTIRRERFVRRAREHRVVRRVLAQMLGISQARVRQIEESAYRRIRHHRIRVWQARSSWDHPYLLEHVWK